MENKIRNETSRIGVLKQLKILKFQQNQLIQNHMLNA